jgi:rhodanese-related sulfurtransferase
MPTPVDRNKLQRLVGEGAQLVEVLPRESYEREHIAGAVSLPLKELDAVTARRLDRDRPVIVYCSDYQ